MTDEFQPFTSKESRDRFLAYLESLEKLWPIQHEGRMIQTRYGETFVRIGGPESALPIVLLPGGHSSSLVWRRLISPLSERFRTYALDAIYDEGRSIPKSPVSSIDDLRLWLDDVLNGLGLNNDITMAGQSYGCYATAEYALHAPNRLRKLIWIAPVMIGAPLSKEFVDRLLQVADGRRESLEAYCRWVMPSISAKHPEEFSRRIDEILLVQECYSKILPPVRAAVMSDEDLKKIVTPTLYILGEADGATNDPRATIERITSLMPHVETMLVPGVGHDIVAAETGFLVERLLKFI